MDNKPNLIWSMYVGDIVKNKTTNVIGTVTATDFIKDEIYVDDCGPYFKDDFDRLIIELSPFDYSPTHDTQTLINRIKQLEEWDSDEKLINHALERYLDGFHGGVSREEFEEQLFQASLSSSDPRKRD